MPISQQENRIFYRRASASTQVSPDKLFAVNDYLLKLRSAQQTKLDTIKATFGKNLIIEANNRMSINSSEFHKSPKAFFNLHNANQLDNEYQKPDLLVKDQIKPQTGNREVVSRFNGWLTVDD